MATHADQKRRTVVSYDKGVVLEYQVLSQVHVQWSSPDHIIRLIDIW